MRKTLSIVQGATDESKTQFSIVHPEGMAISALVTFRDGQTMMPDRVQLLRFAGQATSVTQVFFSRLMPDEDMELNILDAGKKTIDRRVFRALNPDKRSLKFAICSCMHDRHHDPEIWKDLLAQSPDVIFFIGDSTYADQEAQLAGEAAPATLWRRFSESRDTLEIYHHKRLVPILAVWDDHDFGNNDTNSEDYPFVKESQKNFLTFFPQNPEYCRYLERGPGISSCFSFRGQQVLLLDDRSFRLPKGSEDRYAHWGKAQEGWALAHTRKHRGVSWLMNGSQFFPSVAWKESVSRDHPEQFAGFMEELAKARQKVIFASGDVHYSEISRIEPEMLGYETFEVTSSSVHSTSFPGFPDIVPNPRRILSTGKRNYVLVKASEVNGKPVFEVESRSAGAEVRFRKVISI